jgi:TetR/AcrR family transcriptional regulator, regulator of cefoperazone and chloramphenicol sensitivity
MSEENQKQALMDAAKALMEQSEKPEKITSRQIAAQAGVNAAMINYYYGSKDALLSQAVGEILGVAAELFQSPPNPSEPPKARLRQILREICQLVLKYRQYTKILVPRLLLEEEINLPQYVLPEIREHFGAIKNEIDCRIIAYEMVSFMQLAFYRSEAFLRYTGINLSEESACNMLIEWELNQFLPEVKA